MSRMVKGRMKTHYLISSLLFEEYGQILEMDCINGYIALSRYLMVMKFIIKTIAVANFMLWVFSAIKVQSVTFMSQLFKN